MYVCMNFDKIRDIVLKIPNGFVNMDSQVEFTATENRKGLCLFSERPIPGIGTDSTIDGGTFQPETRSVQMPSISSCLLGS